MLKARIPVGSISIEVEAATKPELEDALEAAFNVAMRRNAALHNAYREPETPSASSPVRESPPVQAGGDNPPLESLEEQLPKEAPVANQADTNVKVSYRKAKRIADYARIALEGLGKKYGTDKGFTSVAIREYLEATGGDGLIKKNKQPTSAISQAISNSDVFVRHNGINWLKEWAFENEENFQPQELVKASHASSLDF